MSSLLSLVSLLALLVSLFLVVSPVAGQQCAGVNGTVIVNGPTSPNYEYYLPGADQLLGSTRTLNVTQNVTALSMAIYFNSATFNPLLHITLALYGPPNCGAQGDSVLLGTTAVYALPNATFTAFAEFTLTLNLLTPVVVAPGSYSVIMETDNPNIYLLISPTVAGFTSVIADAYTKNTYSFSNASFPATTYFVIYDQGLDTGATIIGTSCPTGTSVSPLPTCTPRPFLVYPSNALTSLPCSGASLLNIATFNNVTGYPFEIGQGTDLVQLTPIYLAQTQTIYSVGLLVNPDTSASANYTLRPSLYVQTGPNSFALLAQPAQLTIPGSQLAGQFTELYFTLTSPPTVYGGTTVFLNVVVDQVGLVLDFDAVTSGVGGTFSGNTAVSSAAAAPATLITTTSGNPDASRGVLSCVATLPTLPSSSPAAPGSFSGCNGPLIINGPLTDNFVYYWPDDQLLGSTRLLNTTQQVQQLQMSFYWSGATTNTAPVHVSLALYGPPTCGTQGESQLLAATAPYTFVPGQLGGVSVIALPLITPLTVGPGNYTVLAESDNSNLNVVTGNTLAGYQSLVADAYTKNYYAYSNATFVPTTLISIYAPGQDTLAEIISTACVTGTTPAALPTCTPRPFVVYNPAPLSCPGSSVVSQNTFSNFSVFDYQVGVTPNTFQLTPVVIATTQTLSSLAVLVHPETTPNRAYTVKLSVYVSNYLGPSTFFLIGQTAQTVLSGSSLAGQFTEIFLPLVSPVNVPAGLTVYIGVVVDQYGLVLVYDTAGKSLSFSNTQYTFTSNLTAPSNITSLPGATQLDVSSGLMGCATTLPSQSSSSNSPTPPGCYGGTISTGGPITPSNAGTIFGAVSSILGSSRVLNSTQQVTALQIELYWAPSTTSTVSVAATLALYGPPNCGAQGDSQLLGVTPTYTFAAGSLTAYERVVLTLPLVTPITVAPGTYTVFVETNNVGLYVIVGASTTGTFTDAYTVDTYTFSNGQFPATTFIAEYSTSYDTTATIIATGCDNGALLSPLPTCTPIPFTLYPASALSALPCSGTAAIYTNTFSNYTRYFDEVGAANGVTRLMPILITTTQTLYEVSILIAPLTNAGTNYTMRPAIYLQTASNNFSLLASAAQTFLQGSMLANKITEVYFPLTTPVVVTAGTTIWLLRQVDQAGLELLFDVSGGTGVSSATVTNSSLPAAPFLVTTGSGGVDASRGALGCVIPPPPTQSSNLCVILYSLPGTIEYPWSVAYNVNFQYYPTAVTTSSGTAVSIESGSGTRTFTNRFGITSVTPVTVAAYLPQQLGPLIYTGQAAPFDGTGITFNLAIPAQLPGGDPLNPVSQTTLTFSNGAVVEAGSALEDALAQAFLTGVPGFLNTTIGASNLNTLAANYATCQAPISFTNGLRPPTQPSSSNGGTHISYSYTVSDGSTYSVTTILSLTTASAFANSQDQLGSPYQTVTAITGNRTYTYIPTGATLISAVTGLSTTSAAGSNPPDFRFYPYALLSSSPGVYTSNSVPFLDADGLAFTITPAAPALGSPIGFTTTYSTFSVAVSIAGAAVSAVLTEAPFITNRPNPTLQKQSYSFRP